MSTASPTDLALISRYFGKKEGQNLKDLTDEMKKLTAEDKKQLAGGIRDESLTY